MPFGYVFKRTLKMIGNSKAFGECIWYDATTSPFWDSLILVGQRSSFYHHLSVTSVHLMGPAILQILSHPTQKTGPARCQNQSVKSKKNDGIQPLSSLASKYVKTIAVKMEVYCNLLNRWEPVTYLWLFDLSYFKWANFKTNIRLLSVSIFYLRRDTDVLSFPLLMSASFVLIVFEFYIHEPNMMSYKCGLFVAWNDRSDRFGDFRC